MATNARIAKGTLFQRGDSGSPEVFTTIAEVRSITPPSETADDVEVTHMESGSYKEYIRGLIEAGEASLQINYDPTATTHQNVRADHASGTSRNWRFLLVGGQSWTFNGYVKGFQLNMGSPADPVTADITIKVNGSVTVAG